MDITVILNTELRQCSAGKHNRSIEEFTRPLENPLVPRCFHKIGEICNCSMICNHCYDMKKASVQRKKNNEPSRKKQRNVIVFESIDIDKRLCKECKKILLIKEFTRVALKRSPWCQHAAQTECNCFLTCNHCNIIFRRYKQKKKRIRNSRPVTIIDNWQEELGIFRVD